MYTINSLDESREVASYGRKPPDNVIPQDINNCGGFLLTIKLYVESRVKTKYFPIRNLKLVVGTIT